MTYPEIRGDLALVIVVAYVKEPFCVSALLEEVRAHRRTIGERSSVADFRQWLTRMIVQASGAPHSEEMSQLCRQGVGRVMGSTMTCTFLGIIAKQADTTNNTRKNKSAIVLGLSAVKYDVVLPPFDAEGPLDKFIAACRAHEVRFF